MTNWAEAGIFITIAAGAGGIIYKAGQITRAVEDLARRVTRIEEKLDRQRR